MNYPTERGSTHPPPCLSSCSSLCQHKLLCLTNWIQELINWKCVFSLTEVFFSTTSSPKWLGGALNALFFFLPPSPTPLISVELAPTLMQGLNSTEQLEEKKTKSHHDLKISTSLKHCYPFCGGEQFSSAEEYQEENSTGKAFQDKTEQKARTPEVWKWESSRTGKHVSHLPDTDVQGSSSFSCKCLAFPLCVGRTGRYSWEDKSDLPPLISESFPSREGGCRYSPSAGIVVPKTVPAQLDRCTDSARTIPCTSVQGRANLRPNMRQLP